jgi:hypothetical protein
MPNPDLNLFALTNDPGNKIAKFGISHEIQNNLNTFFLEQERDFNNNIDETIEFDGKYKPEQNELLKISNFDDIDNLEDAIRRPLAMPDINPTEETFGTIKALFTGYLVDGNANILIQRFEKRRIITNNGFTIFHENNTYRKIEDIGLTVDGKLTGILNNGTLTFKSFHLMRQIFDLTDYYKEATDSDIELFSQLETIKIENLGNFLSLADSWIRRKIALIQQSGILETVPLRTIKAVADGFLVPLDLATDNGNQKIDMPNDRKAIKAILRLLDEDYYESPLSQTHCIANSKRKIE